MKKLQLRTLGAALLAILMLAALAQVVVSAQGNGSDRSLAGSWDVEVTARDCQTGAKIFSFPATMTYNQDGTMQETDLGGPGLVRLQGHGVWTHQSARQYSAAFRFLNFLPDRTFVGTNVVRSSINLGNSGDDYTSTDTAELIDANGNAIPLGCATTTATRFK